jgi:16S rRNA (uracil1498-N3)-methyltransferase
VDDIISAVNARFYLPRVSGPGQLLALPEDEAQHLTRVLRLGEGAPISVFDGRGREFDAVVEKAGKSEVLVAVGSSRIVVEREPAVSLTLAQAVLKGDQMDAVVRDAVMMGVAAIQPLVATRSEVTLAALERGRRRDRWQRVAISSAKQCGRAVVPEIIDPVAFDELVQPGAIGTAFTFVEPVPFFGRAKPLAAFEAMPPAEASLFIGPEGGWTADEVDLAATVTHLVTLGRLTFRADAMALVALSAVLTLWKEF